MTRSERPISEMPSSAGNTSAASPDFFDTFQVLSSRSTLPILFSYSPCIGVDKEKFKGPRVPI